MSDQGTALARLVEDIENLRLRVDEVERRAGSILEEANRKLLASGAFRIDTLEGDGPAQKSSD